VFFAGMNEGERVSLPLEILQKLMPAAAAAGIELPGMARFAPTIDVTQSISGVALEVGRLVAKQNIFLKSNEVVTVDEATGDIARMTARRFPAWLEQYAAFKAPGARQKRDSLAVEDAGQILETDIFRSCLRPLTAVHTMRLPVQRKGELWALEFLSPGYDAETGIFTVELLKYDMEWDIERATKFLDEHGAEYCFTWPNEEARGNVALNRSWAVQIAAMVGLYCKAMFEPGTPRPIILYVGNKPGTGKSTLAAMALIPIFGTASTTAIPKDDDRMISTLETVGRTRRPYIFFDDVPFGIFNNALYQFVLSRSHSGRVMGANAEFFEEANVTQVFATGNDIKFDDNLKRRALLVDLFLDTEVRGREFRRVINPTYLARESVRAEFLSSLCSIVRNYVEMRPRLNSEQVAALKPLESFETWTETISAIVQLAGYADPLAPADLAGSGSEEDDEIKELLVKVATEAEKDAVFSRLELMEKARGWGLLEGLVGMEGEPPPDSKANKSWGRRLQKYRGQKYVDGKGRRFQFSHRRQKKGASYPLSFLPSSP
jgi:hypothetical protein